MKFICFYFILTASYVLHAQEWKFEVGSNITDFVFTNSLGNNPNFLKPIAGYHFAISKEHRIGKHFVYDLGIALNQYNAVGDVQNIPFSYQTNFIGITSGVGPSFTIYPSFTVSTKISGAIQSMYNGTQFVQNNYIDLSRDSQFSGLKSFLGYTIEMTKKINNQVSLYIQFQHLDTNSFGKSSLNFIPSTINLGIKISQ